MERVNDRRNKVNIDLHRRRQPRNLPRIVGMSTNQRS